MFNGKRISDLIEERKVTKVSVYNYAEISKGQLDNIINGRNTPNGDTIERIADFFSPSHRLFFSIEK